MIFQIAACVFILDRITKSLVINHVFLGQSIKIIPKIFDLTLVLNTGTAFGLFKGQRIIFILSSIAIIVAAVIYILKHKNIDKKLSWALGLILGGAAGNLLDRVVHGCVVDFLDFHIWPVFNIADSCITIGVTILILDMWTRSSKSKT